MIEREKMVLKLTKYTFKKIIEKTYFSGSEHTTKLLDHTLLQYCAVFASLISPFYKHYVFVGIFSSP